jgi:uncharacterized protein involved in exopolysaccharide biosynthesis
MDASMSTELVVGVIAGLIVAIILAILAFGRDRVVALWTRYVDSRARMRALIEESNALLKQRADEIKALTARVATLEGGLAKALNDLNIEMSLVRQQADILDDVTAELEVRAATKDELAAAEQRQNDAHRAYEQGIGGNVTALGQQVSELRTEIRQHTSSSGHVPFPRRTQ